MDFFKSFFDVTKLPTKIFLVVSIVTGVFIFSSVEILEKLQLNKFKEYGAFVGIAFLFSTVLVIVNFIVWVFNRIHLKYRLYKWKAEIKQILEDLDPQEKAVLREFAIQRQNSIEMPYDDTVVSGLIDKQILRYNKQLGSSFIANGTRVSMSIHKTVNKLVKLEHIDLSKGMTEEEQERLLQNRPDWINSRW